MKCTVYFVASLFSCVVSVAAISEPLTVIFDGGNTLSIEPYLNIGTGASSKSKEKKASANLIRTPIQYPVTTPSMQPGIVESRAMAIPHFQTPLFIIGNDAMSKQWLVSRLNELRHINAVGLLVEADSRDDLMDIKALAKGLRIEAVSGEVIAEQLDLKHYPAFISKFGIEQ